MTQIAQGGGKGEAVTESAVTSPKLEEESAVERRLPPLRGP